MVEERWECPNCGYWRTWEVPRRSLVALLLVAVENEQARHRCPEPFEPPGLDPQVRKQQRTRKRGPSVFLPALVDRIEELRAEGCTWIRVLYFLRSEGLYGGSTIGALHQGYHRAKRHARVDAARAAGWADAA